MHFILQRLQGVNSSKKDGNRRVNVPNNVVSHVRRALTGDTRPFITGAALEVGLTI